MVGAGVAITLAGLLAGAPAGSGGFALADTAVSPASANLAACVEASQALDVVMAVDESGSLSETTRNPNGTLSPPSDPTGRRVDGIKAALFGLASLAAVPEAGSDKTPSVKTLLEGFSGPTETAPSFRAGKTDEFESVSDADLPTLFQQADVFRSKDTGQNTDFTAALTVAHDALSADAAAATLHGGTAPCQAIVLFTDGQLDLGSKAATTAAFDELCRPGGVADQIHRDGITMFTVALSPAGSDVNESFLQSLADSNPPFAEGSENGCGTLGRAATGQLLSAADANALSLLFGTLFSPAGGSGILTAPGSFFVPDWANRFVLRVSSSAAGSAVRLGAPNGAQATLVIGSSTNPDIPGAVSTVTPLSDVSSTLAVSVSPGEDRGLWTVQSVSGSATLFELEMDSDVTLDTAGDSSVTPGVPLHLVLAPHPISGTTATTILPAGTTVDASLETVSGSEPLTVVPSGGGFAAEVSVDAADQSPDYQIRAHLVLPAAEGIAVNTVPIDITLKRGFPDVPTTEPATLNLTSISGKHAGTAQILVHGARGSSGCVWFTDATVAAPSSAGAVMATVAPAANSEQSCLAIAAGQTRTVTVTVTPSKSANGLLRGSVVVHVLSTSHPTPVLVTHPIDGWMRRPPDIPRRWAIFAILLALLVALPFAAVHAVNWFTGRLTPLTKLRATKYDVEVRPEGVYEASSGQPFRPPPRDFEDLRTIAQAGAARPFRGPESIAGVSFRAVASGRLRDRRFRPFKGPYGVASTANGAPMVAYRGAKPLVRIRDDAHWETPLQLGALWFFRPQALVKSLIGPDRGQLSGVRGELSVIVRDGESADAEAKLASEAAEILTGVSIPEPEAAHPDKPRPRRLSRLRRTKLKSTAPPPPPPVDDDRST